MTQPRNPVFSNTNSVVVLGAVARPLEIVEMNNGGKRVRLTVAGEEVVADASGKVTRIPFYEPAVAFGKKADDLIALNLSVGDAVLMDGKFKMRHYTDKDGVERKELEVDYSAIRRALGYDKAERTKDAQGAVRLVGGFAHATVFGRVVGNGGDLRYTTQGTPIFNASINARSSWKEGDEWVNEAAFVRTTIFGPLAEEVAKLEVAKGMDVLAEGRIKRGSYKNREGRKTCTTEISITRMVIADAVASSGGGGFSFGGSLNDLPDFGGGDFPADEELPF